MNTSDALAWCRVRCATVEFEDSGFRAVGSDEPISTGLVRVTIQTPLSRLELAGEVFEETVSALADAYRNLGKRVGDR